MGYGQTKNRILNPQIGLPSCGPSPYTDREILGLGAQPSIRQRTSTMSVVSVGTLACNNRTFRAARLSGKRFVRERAGSPHIILRSEEAKHAHRPNRPDHCGLVG